MIIYYHMIALALGIVLDLIIGDPYRMPHPIRLIGNFIGYLDGKALPKGTGDDSLKSTERDPEAELKKGRLIVIKVTAVVFIAVGVIIVGSYLISPYLGMAIEAILTAYALAAKSLKTESMKVYRALKKGSLERARKAVSMIVGRDTESLDEAGVTRAAVETVAENTSDGVIAPLFYLALGGPIFGMLYKAINTMDSMIGYKNERYIYIGRAAAKLDDAVNFVPARLSALLMILSTFFAEHFGAKKENVYDARAALWIFKRDRFNHKSPNSAQTESVVAGALGLKLAGDAVYFGKIVKKPYIGDDKRPAEPEDIKRTNKLMYISFITGGIIFIICLFLLSLIERSIWI